MKVLDVSNPVAPALLGELDTLGSVETNYSVAADDSFAYMGWFNQPFFRVADITDPANPRYVGSSSNVFEYAQDMVLRDTLVYCADHYQFEVVNVADPTNPRVVGSCGLGDMNIGLCLQDTLAYIGSWFGLIIVNIARPDMPLVVSTTGGTRTSTDGVAVRDTFVYVPSSYETLWVFSVADPRTPYVLAGAPLGTGNWGHCASVVDSLVYVGCNRNVTVVDVSDARNPRAVGSCATPTWVRRVAYAEPYVYACCFDAGVVVLETTAVGQQEPNRTARPQAALRVTPNPAGGLALVGFGAPLHAPGRLSLYDATGRRVSAKPLRTGVKWVRLHLSGLPPGLYFILAETGTGVHKSRLVKR
jgi:hypothetical protein